MTVSCLLLALAAAPLIDGGVPTPSERTATLRSSLQSSWELSSERCVQERSSCEPALLDWFRLAQLRRAERAPAPTRARSCEADAGSDLRGCLAAHFGAGTLVSGCSSDFLYAVPSAEGVRLIIGTQHDAQLTLFLDEMDSSTTMRSVIERAAQAIERSCASESDPLGSERFIGFTEGDGGVLARDTPAHGGFVVCAGEQRIAPLGGLVEVTLRGVGYHPEETEQHVVFLYQAPCSGVVFGKRTNGPRVGRYSKRATAAVITKTCADTSCTLAMRLKGRATDFTLAHGAEAMDTGSLQPLGDLNRDGVMDYLLSWSDAGGGSTRLLVSATSGWGTAAAWDYEQ